MDFIPLERWFDDQSDQYMIISGPCSAETRGQVLETAKQLDKITQVQVFRAGVWKPRTRPGSFEGVGVKALEWLKEVKEKTRLKVAVEVATAMHVEQALKHGVDILWIGARTTVNPFSVQAIADALRGVDVPVLVKNPLNPDLYLWVGALERVYGAGVRRLAAVHRGFFPFEKTHLRNVPKWEIAIELKSKFHGLPIICDPSHMAGDSAYIESLAQKSLDLDLDGLMIEAHIDPQNALSDASQQVTPAQLKVILENLRHRVVDVKDRDYRNILEEIRGQIDSIDRTILETLAQRDRLVRRIGKEKMKRNISVLQLERWEQMRSDRLIIAGKLGLDEKFVKNLLELLHKESISLQTQIMNKRSV